MSEKDFRSKARKRIENYFIAIESLISAQGYDIITGLGRLRGEDHLTFTVNFFNERLSDTYLSKKIDPFNLYLCIGFDREIHRLLFQYVLDVEIDGEEAKYCAGRFRIEDNFLRCLCDAGIRSLPHRRYTSDIKVRGGVERLFEEYELSLILDNLFEFIIIRKDYYKQYENSRDFRMALTMCILNGEKEKIENYIIHADETLTRMIISECSKLITKSWDITASDELKLSLRYLLEFMREFPIDKVPYCKEEWIWVFHEKNR